MIRRVSRYVPKKFFGALIYLILLGSLYFFYSNNTSNNSGSNPRFNYDSSQEDPFVYYHNLPKKDWHNYKLIEDELKREGLGEQGKPVKLDIIDDELKKHQDELYRVNGYNAYISDLIPLNRSIKDIRHSECKKQVYSEKLPTVTVIFPFHNEHNTTLLRSVYSVLIRSPEELLKEVILVDDGSTKDALKEPLEEYLKNNGLSNKVKIVRTGKREGLIRARQIGAKHATSEIIVFLDAHSEANYNWLPPLIDPIAQNYKTVVCPFVDVIDCDTYELRPQDEGARGSFDWEFNYKRLPLTEEDLKNPVKPFNSPIMAGGYFAISTKWFWELGGYDEGLDIWGGEQYELSFKVWQCHGKMVDSPCSRVGHIYRCKYVPFPNPGIGDFVSRNYKRVAEVWMDEYKEHLYKRKPNIRDANTGDLTKQKFIREKHKCKSFDWFMKEIAFDQDKFYPAIEPPDGANGEIRSVAVNKCVDTLYKGNNERFELRKCISDDPREHGEQDLRLSFWEDIRPMKRTFCFDVSTSVEKSPVVMFSCHGMKGNQHFKYYLDKQQIYHPVSRLCLDCDPDTGELFMSHCDENKTTQKWKWQNTNEKIIQERNNKS